MKKNIMFIGMDVHKKSIDIAIAQGGRDGEVMHYCQIDGTLAALDKVIRKLVSKNAELYFVYEAGPCGYQIYRHLTAKGFDCKVVAPSLIPRQSGNRIKNDRRDSLMLARLHRSGDLTSVYVPLTEDEALRDLIRARKDIKEDEKRCKQRLSAFLLRSGFRYTGHSSWTQAHRRWIADIKMIHASQQIVLQEYVDHLDHCSLRVQRLTEQIHQLIPKWRMFPVVQALQSLRGISLLTAATITVETGSFNRFDHPDQLMNYFGLVPSEYSTGENIKRGPITKAGNSHVRRLLIEAAWSYRHRARVTRPLLKRQEKLPPSIRDISWKAQMRLCARYRHFWAKGKTKQVITTAIARELCGFIWAIAIESEALLVN